MRLALQALFGHDKDLTGGERTRIENELRKNARSVEFFRKIRQTTSTPLRKAPEVFADESFPDPNIVAEYLDCQLDSSEISEEYERVCDESPEILAEVADCYDILNNRLPQPPVVPQNCRQQLYYVAWEEEPPTVSVKETKKTAGDSDKNAGRSARSPYEEPVIDVKPDPSVRVNARVDKRRGDASRNEVQVKIKSRGARFGRLGAGVKCALLFVIVAGGINGYAKWRSKEKSQTFNASAGVVQNETTKEEDSFRPFEETTSSGFITPDAADPSSFDGAGEYVDVENGVGSDSSSEPPMLSMKPTDSFPANSSNDGSFVGGSRNERRGLGSSHDGRRERIEIPDDNNDVFSKTMRY